MHRQYKVRHILGPLFLALWVSTSAYAQDPDPILDPIIGSQLIDDPTLTNNSDPIATDNGPGGLPTDPGVPVDGGLSLLLAAGAAYGARKLRRESAPRVLTEKVE